MAKSPPFITFGSDIGPIRRQESSTNQSQAKLDSIGALSISTSFIGGPVWKARSLSFNASFARFLALEKLARYPRAFICKVKTQSTVNSAARQWEGYGEVRKFQWMAKLAF